MNKEQQVALNFVRQNKRGHLCLNVVDPEIFDG
jgi:hypothetical protein